MSGDGQTMAICAYNGYVQVSFDAGFTWGVNITWGTSTWTSATLSGDGHHLVVTTNNNLYISDRAVRTTISQGAMILGGSTASAEFYYMGFGLWSLTNLANCGPLDENSLVTSNHETCLVSDWVLAMPTATKFLLISIGVGKWLIYL